MKLTPLEIEIMLDRLNVPKCIAEALERDGNEVEACCDYLIGCLDLGFPEKPSPLMCDILAECIEGSTYCGATLSAANDREISQAKYRAVVRAAESLADKIGKLIGREVRAMTC